MDFMGALPPHHRGRLRKDAIGAVLATDMKSHFSLVSMFSTKLSSMAISRGSHCSGSSIGSSIIASGTPTSTIHSSVIMTGSVFSPAGLSQPLFQVLDEDLRILVLQVDRCAAGMCFRSIVSSAPLHAVPHLRINGHERLHDPHQSLCNSHFVITY